MKKRIALLCAAALLLGAAACGKTSAPGETAVPESETAAADETTAPQGEGLLLRVIDGGGTGMLTLAGETAGDVYTASADELTVYLDGQPSSADALANGMLLTVEPGYELLETWPAQFAGAAVSAETPGKNEGYGDLCGLYLSVLENLWNNDEALNAEIAYISVDLSAAPGGLSEGERTALAWLFAGRHNAQALTMSFEELKENGYVNETELYWKDGVLLSLKATDNEKQSEKKITFDAEKWRSGTGAIFFNGCTAKRGKGPQWEPYQPGSFSIA